MMQNERVLVTGVAGFIGAALSGRLLSEGAEVWGIDNLNDYYDVELKKSRLAKLEPQENFRFQQLDLTEGELLKGLFERFKPTIVVNLAAQAGVRYSLENPDAYVKSNVTGFVNLLEATRSLEKNHKGTLKHFVYASSSSVYGGNTKTPFSESDEVLLPQSLYAATKRSNELMAQTYAHLYNIPCTGLRFFTVYGEYGRPDMSPMLFATAIMENKPIKVFNNGDMLRDFTYIDDIVEGVVRIMNHLPTNTPPSDIFNIGNNSPVKLMDYIETMEKSIGKEAIKEMLPMQDGDVYQTYADTSKLESAVGWKPSTPLTQGLAKFAEWFKQWHKKSTDKAA